MIPTLDSMLVEVKPGNRVSLLEALTHLAVIDADFCEDNGEEYNWDVTNEMGLECNFDYVLYQANLIEDDTECAATFFDMWLKNDSYYKGYDYHFLYNDKGEMIAISLAVMYGD